MTGPPSYLLCGLLASTGVAGRPESWFREPDEEAYAHRLGVPVPVEPRRFVRAVRAAGSTPNGVFAARVMWGTLPRLLDGLAPPPRTRSDLAVLAAELGPLRLVHLRRQDVVGQAVSWARAEQTGYWQDGDRAGAGPRFDLGQLDGLVRTVREHDAAWDRWFAAQGAEPHRVTYEQVTADPGGTVRGILDALGLVPPPGWAPAPRERRQADKVNADWVRRYRAETGRGSSASADTVPP